MDKYKLTSETLQFAGRTLHRIKAVKDISHGLAPTINGVSDASMALVKN